MNEDIIILDIDNIMRIEREDKKEYFKDIYEKLGASACLGNLRKNINFK